MERCTCSSQLLGTEASRLNDWEKLLMCQEKVIVIFQMSLGSDPTLQKLLVLFSHD